MIKFAAVFIILTLISNLYSNEPVTEYDKYWPQWRGPQATGVAPHGNPPVSWSEENNIRWKIEISGKGHASPIIWENTVFVLTANPTGETVESAASQNDTPPSGEQRRRGRRGIQPTNVLQFNVMAISRRDGSVLWQKTARETLPHEGTHRDLSLIHI